MNSPPLNLHTDGRASGHRPQAPDRTSSGAGVERREAICSAAIGIQSRESTLGAAHGQPHRINVEMAADSPAGLRSIGQQAAVAEALP